MPCASAAELSRVIDRVIGLSPGCWMPILLHTGWEIGDNFRALAVFARNVASTPPHGMTSCRPSTPAAQSISAQMAAGPDPLG